MVIYRVVVTVFDLHSFESTCKFAEELFLQGNFFNDGRLKYRFI